MSIYNELYQSTVNNILGALETQQATLESTQTSAQYALYYAQSAEITAIDKLNDTALTVEYCQAVNDQSITNKNQSFNLLSTANSVNANVIASNANMAIAASNLQIASNAITSLASDIGAALNVATASLYNTQTYNMVLEANNFVNEVANDSKAISMLAMDASGKTSEIIAAVVLAQASTVDAKIATLLSAIQADLDKYTTVQIAENVTVSTTKKSERQAEGGLLDANAQASAINAALSNANMQLNLGLNVTAKSIQTVNVSFLALAKPLPTFCALPASQIPIPDVNPSYYLAIVEKSQSRHFSPDRVSQLFAQRGDLEGAYFYPLQAPIDDQGEDLYLNNDVYGMPIIGGTSYIAFLYVELSMDYKRLLGNFSDIVTAGSPTFVPAISCPLVQNIGVQKDSQAATQTATLSFAIAKNPYVAMGFDVLPNSFPIVIEGKKTVALLQAAYAAVPSSNNVLPSDSKLSTLYAQLTTLGKQITDSANVAVDHFVSAFAYDELLACNNLTDNEKKNFSAKLLVIEQALSKNIAIIAGSADQIQSTVQSASQIAISGTAIELQALSNANNLLNLSQAVVQSFLILGQFRTDFAGIEFRCTMVRASNSPDLALMTDSQYSRAPVIINLNIAQQIPTSNLEIATRTLVRLPKTGSPPKQDAIVAVPTPTDGVNDDASGQDLISVDASSLTVNIDQIKSTYQCRYVVHFNATSTDNFGNKIEPDISYQPYVLSTIPDNAAYLDMLTQATTAFAILTT